MANRAQRSFAGGEIAPSLYARTDTAKYQTALRKLLNYLIHRHGGISNTPGTHFTCEVKDSARTVRLKEFIFNEEQTYLLEFGNGYIRFIRDGAQLESSPGVPYEIATPYSETDLMTLRFVQSADVITIVHQAYAPRNLSRLGDTNWTLELIDFGPSIGQVTNLSASGTAGTDTIYYAVSAVDAVTGEEGLPAFFTLAAITTPSPTDPVTVSWDPLAGAGSYRVYRSTDGATYELTVNAGGTPTGFSDTSWTTATASVVCASQDVWEQSAGQARNPVIAAGANKPFDQRFTIKGVFTCDYNDLGGGIGTLSGRLRAYYSRDGETRVDAGVIASGAAFGGGSGWSEQFIASITVPDNGYAALTIDLVPEGYAYNPVAGDVLTASVDFTLFPGTFDRIEWQAMGTGFVDDGSAGDPLQTPLRDRQLFDSPDEFPAAVAIYQQRKLFANTIAEPETVYGSRTGAYDNFLISTPLQDDDAVTWSMAGNRVNRVKHLLDLGKLIVFTSGNEMKVEGDDTGILSPTGINPQKISANGASDLPPLEVSNSAVYVQARGTIVRDIQPLETSEGYRSSDLTLYAAHLTKGVTLDDWTYALAPDSILWIVRSDGVLLGLTYLPEESIWGWHRHTTDGVYERVCAVPEGDEDAVYVVVRRTINGNTKRYIERFASRYVPAKEDAFFVHCGLSYDGAPTATVSGLDHLEGENVSVLADGVVVANPNRPVADMPHITVSGGSITLPAPASKIHVGLPYMSDIETLDIDTPQGRSVKEGKLLTNRVMLSLEATQGGIHIGQSAPNGVDPLEDLTELEFDDAQLVTDTVSLDAIIAQWNGNARIFVRQVDPLPVTILAAIPQGYM